LYQVGSFIGDRWGVWNGRFRDTARRFVKSDPGTVTDLADAISGSFRVFSQLDRDPMRSINFITAHDGFTLNDLVSYDEKHNQVNGEDNRDGNNQNDSWNCGAEGPTDDPQVEALRNRQLRNFFTILLLSQGRPMFLMGDEVRRTQQGNNNAYSQDNEISWFDWSLVDTHRDLLRFVSGLLHFRQNSELFRDRRYWFEPEGTDVFWHGVRLDQPDWGENSHSLAFELTHPTAGDHLYIICNAYWEPLEFELPALSAGQGWACLVDTGLPAPADFSEPAKLLPEGARTCLAQSRSAVVLVACNLK
jgi:glycogen operon protein